MKRVLDRLNSLEITGTSDHLVSGDVVEIFARVPKFSSDPGPESGIVIWVNTTEEKLKVRNAGEVLESVLTKSGRYLSHFVLEDTDFSRAELTNASLTPLGRFRLGVSTSLGVGSVQLECALSDYGNLTYFVLKPNGDVWAWGWNNNGHLGIGRVSSETFEWDPHQTLFSNIKKVSACWTHTLALSTTGVLWGCGSNAYYQVSSSDLGANLPTPVQISTNVLDMVAIDSATVFVKTDGTVWFCGLARNGRSGHSPFYVGSSNVRYSTQIPNLENITNITKWGDECLMVLDDNQDIWIWGTILNQYSQPGSEFAMAFKLGSGVSPIGSPYKVVGVPKVEEIGPFYFKDINGNYWTYLDIFNPSGNTDHSMAFNTLIRSPLESVEKPYNYFSKNTVVTQSGEVWIQ